MNKDIMKVLKMIEEGTITAEEAEKLITAMDISEDTKKVRKTSAKRDKKNIRVKILEDSKTKVNINLPWTLVDIVAKIGTKFIPYDDIPNGEELKNIDWDEIIEAVEGGLSGKLVDIQDGDDSIEVYVE